jgi:hypothetical protein
LVAEHVGKRAEALEPLLHLLGLLLVIKLHDTGHLFRHLGTYEACAHKLTLKLMNLELKLLIGHGIPFHFD